MRKYLLLAAITIASVGIAQEPQHIKNVWGDIDSNVAPWAVNVSRPNKITNGLEGRHLSLWASHGRFYDQDRSVWRWQRPNLFCTTEDLFTQTIVVPYLIPMLEKAGAYVFTPRERDWQTAEYIVGNDYCWPNGRFGSNSEDYEEKSVVGFNMHPTPYLDDENPFVSGTAMVVKTTRPQKATTFSFTPHFAQAGRYAVYVCYPFMEDAVDDVKYTVHHKGVETDIVVNQQIGFGTWVYLGTFDFDDVASDDVSVRNGVTVTNASRHKGSIGIDAVRFGGGMGNINRGGITSGMPRCLEGARYYGQWAGAPYKVYSDKGGVNDYGDDINVRSLMTNWIGGGSCFMPDSVGLKVPIELSLAVHSDAGYHDDGMSIYGSLAIATTNHNDGLLAAGISRQTSLDFASQLLENLTRDMTHLFGAWDKRYLWDRNYSETRLPNVPSAIIETLSHQSFPDMVVGQHPYGKFQIARSIYKTILKYVCEQHNSKYVVAPLTPTDFRLELKDDNQLLLSWNGVKDPEEETATATSYNIYTSVGDLGFDNGQNVEGNRAEMHLLPGVQYNFRITACNAGGESFPTETLSAYISPRSKEKILVVSGFERLSAPYIINTDSLQGFDLARDPGVQMGIYPGWSGYQQCFSKSTMGQEDETGLGYCGNEMVGNFVMGNDFRIAEEHTSAIASAKRYSVVSTSLSAVNKGFVNLNEYSAVDIAFGLQKDDGQLGLHYKTFSPRLQRALHNYSQQKGRILISGSYIGSDMTQPEEQSFMKDILKLHFDSSYTNGLFDRSIEWNGKTNGLGMEYEIYNTLNSNHYAATAAESLMPEDGSICAMIYSNGHSAAVGYKGDYSTMTVGFPIECIKDKQQREQVMQGLIGYLLSEK